jgi:hypothetical protein
MDQLLQALREHHNTRARRANGCRLCGESHPSCLIRRKGRPPICYQCQRQAQGARGREEHHVIGRAASDVALLLPSNAHRILDDYKREWAPERPRHAGDPLARAALFAQAIADHATLSAERDLPDLPLDAFLCDGATPIVPPERLEGV